MNEIVVLPPRGIASQWRAYFQKIRTQMDVFLLFASMNETVVQLPLRNCITTSCISSCSMHAGMFVRMHVHIHMYIMYICIHMCIYIYIHIYICIHMYKFRSLVCGRPRRHSTPSLEQRSGTDDGRPRTCDRGPATDDPA